jgi:hypothetical protein
MAILEGSREFVEVSSGKWTYRIAITQAVAASSGSIPVQRPDAEPRIRHRPWQNRAHFVNLGRIDNCNTF